MDGPEPQRLNNEQKMRMLKVQRDHGGGGESEGCVTLQVATGRGTEL